MTTQIVSKEEKPVQALTIIADLARDKDMTPEKLDRYIDAQIKIMNKQAEIEFNQAMAQLKKELGPVAKNKVNNQTNSKYADLDAIKEIVDPLLAKFGFFDRYEDEYPEPGIIKTTCEIVHEMGHSKRNSVQFTLDDKGIKGTINKTPIHAAASSMTYGQRLALCRALGIRISKDDDGNDAGTHKITDEQRDEIQNLIDDAGIDIGRFCSEYLQLDSIADIPAIHFIKVKNAILKRTQKNVDS